MRIEWRDGYNTGISGIDQDHRKLVALINELDDVLNKKADLAEIGRIIDELADYTDYHFSREERLMAAVSYENTAQHAYAHAEFGRFVGGMIGECMISPSEDTARRLKTYLAEWLVDHILDEDMAFAASVR